MEISRVRLGAVLGIDQILSWGTTCCLPAIVMESVTSSLDAEPARR
jgi:hypothetical protein